MIDLSKVVNVPNVPGVPAEDYALYQDYDDANVVRIARKRPRVRIAPVTDKDGKVSIQPVFKFIRYRSAGADLKGGYVTFETDLYVPLEHIDAIGKSLGKKVLPLDVVDARAAVEIVGNDKSIVLTQPSLSAASAAGDFAAAFGIQLTPEGATLLNKTMTDAEAGATSAVIVRHILKVPSRAEAMKVTVTFDATKNVQMVKDVVEQRRSSTWGEERTQVETLRKKIEAANVANVSLDPGPHATEEDKKAAREWGWAQLASIAAAAAQNNELESLRDTRVFTESVAAERDLPFQTTLPPQSKELFKDVDLDDIFFKQFAIGVTTNANFTLPIDRLVVHVKYADEELFDFVFTKENSGERKRPMRNGKPVEPALVGDAAGKPIYKYTYWSEVFYSNGTRYESPKFETEVKELTVSEGEAAGSGKSPAVRSRIFDLAVDGTVIDWTGTKSAQVEVELKEGNDTRDTYNVTLTSAKPLEYIRVPFGDDLAPPYRYTYRVTYLPVEGDEVTVEQKTARTSARLQVPELFKALTEVKVRLGAKAEAADVRLTWEERDSGYTTSSSELKLTAEKPAESWKLRQISRLKGELTCRGTVRRKKKETRVTLKNLDPRDTILIDFDGADD